MFHEMRRKQTVRQIATAGNELVISLSHCHDDVVAFNYWPIQLAPSIRTSSSIIIKVHVDALFLVHQYSHACR